MLLIYGDKDHMISDCRKFKEYFPDQITEKIIPDGNHFLAAYKPELVADYIKEYLRK